MGDMAFESNNPSGLTFKIDASPDEGGQGVEMKSFLNLNPMSKSRFAGFGCLVARTSKSF
jgi:hypothetical protein